MRIKEVQEATGLTAKAIRLYESKGLLEPAREAENDYRDYSQADVERLKTIAVLRRLDVPVREIKSWTDGERSLEQLLTDAAAAAAGETERERLRAQAAADLRDAVAQNPNLNLAETMARQEEVRNAMGELERMERERKGSLITPVWITVVCLGLFFLPFGYLAAGETREAALFFVLALVAMGVIAFTWADYLHVPRGERRRKGCFSAMLLAVAVFSATLCLSAVVELLQKALFLPEGDTALLFRTPWLLYLLEGELFAVCVALGERNRRLLRKLRGKWAVALVLLNLLLFYGCLTGVSVATEEGICRHSFWNPAGTFYRFDAVTSVDTGFRGETMGFRLGAGEFYYRVTYGDGITEDWAQGIGQREEVDWLWLTRMDARIAASGAEKTASEEYVSDCKLDPVYIETLLRIIRH